MRHTKIVSLQAACPHHALSQNHLHLLLDFLDALPEKGGSDSSLRGWGIAPVGRGHVLVHRLHLVLRLYLEDWKVRMYRHDRDRGHDHEAVLIDLQTCSDKTL